jgi:amidohydrolase
MDIVSLVERHLPAGIELRHRLHRLPELQYQEYETAKLIRQELARLGIDAVAGVPGAPTATIAWLGDASKPCVALRADMDALPIDEKTGLEYASTHPGRMHACGHDGHMAGLLGTAAILKELETTLPVCVKLIWQPAEEGGAGAARLVEAGVLDGRLGPRVAAIFGLHGWPALKAGTVATRPGVILAATDAWEATVTGAGCHAAYPHFGHDPILAAAEAVMSAQAIVSREVDPTDSAVVSVTKFHAGTADNVIPDAVTLGGTIRTINDTTRQLARRSFERRMAAVAAAHECRFELRWRDCYPPTVNDPAMADYVARVAREALGEDHYVPVGRPSLGGEDFAYYLEKTPGCFVFLGVQPAEAQSHPLLHTDRFDFTDAALATGMRMLVELALRFRPTGG